MSAHDPAQAALAAIGPHGLRSADELDAVARLWRTAWPEQVTVDKAGFFNRGAIRRLVIRAGEHAYVAWTDGGGVVHELGGVSLGVVVRVQRCDPRVWAERLHEDFGRRTGPPQTAY